MFRSLRLRQFIEVVPDFHLFLTFH